jgi:hypothetical protein
MLSFEDFTAQAIAILAIPGDRQIAPGSRLSEDIEFDSLDFFIFVTFIEEISGAAPGSAEGHPLATMGDGFDLYAALCREAP